MTADLRAEILGLSARLSAELTRGERLRTEHGDELPAALAEDLEEWLECSCGLAIECERVRRGISITEEE